MDGPRVVALSAFVLSYGAIMSGRVHRAVAALAGAVAVGLFVLPPARLLEAQNWETLLFIFGMMVVIGTLERSGAFRWLGLHVARWARLDALRLFVGLSFLAAVLAAFVDSITVMLFLASLTVEVARLAEVPALPIIVAEITAANIGGAATLVGDPPNVILGTHFGLSFLDFAWHTGPPAMLALALNMGLLLLVFRGEVLGSRRQLAADPAARARRVALLRPDQAVKDLHLFRTGWLALAVVVALLVVHREVGVPIGVIGVCAGALVLLVGGQHKMGEVLESLDWATLLFFGALFLIVGAMEQTGLLDSVAGFVRELSGGRVGPTVSVLLWFGAFGSAVVDNVPFAATMAPLIGHLAGPGMSLEPLVWATALGTDIGGNMTPIGASANVVGLAVYERATGDRVTWGRYLRAAVPATLAAVVSVNAFLWLVHR